MCCLFGFLDPDRTLTCKQKNRLLAALATAAEARGTDATGIAYNAGGKLRVYKRPKPGHTLTLRIPAETAAVLGHTRMTTQGSAKRNYNNHPFLSHVPGTTFALVHNGMLHNDYALRRSLSLPHTHIQTDSYVAVQLIEQKKALDFSSLKYMAERVEGSFTFSILNDRDELYLVKGDNPLCLYQDTDTGLWVWASTGDILKKALTRAGIHARNWDLVPLCSGELLRIDARGEVTRSRFNDAHLWHFGFHYPWRPYEEKQASGTAPYLDEIKAVASAFGYTPQAIDHLAQQGFSPEELEELLYGGEI